MGCGHPRGLRLRHRLDGQAKGADHHGRRRLRRHPVLHGTGAITKARKDLTARADIHGLGAILYHMLTGRPPYQGATVLETMDLVQRQDPIPPRQLNPNIPSDLETICLKCLQKEPAKPKAVSLGRIVRGRSWNVGSALGQSWRKPASTFEKSSRPWCRRRPVVAAIAAAVALTLLIGFPAVIVLWRQADAAPARADANVRMLNEQADAARARPTQTSGC